MPSASSDELMVIESMVSVFIRLRDYDLPIRIFSGDEGARPS